MSATATAHHAPSRRRLSHRPRQRRGPRAASRPAIPPALPSPRTKLAPQSIPFASIVRCLVALVARRRTAASSAGTVGHRASFKDATPPSRLRMLRARSPRARSDLATAETRFRSRVVAAAACWREACRRGACRGSRGRVAPDLYLEQSRRRSPAPSRPLAGPKPANWGRDGRVSPRIERDMDVRHVEGEPTESRFPCGIGRRIGPNRLPDCGPGGRGSSPVAHPPPKGPRLKAFDGEFDRMARGPHTR
jgi:hypothetical protein